MERFPEVRYRLRQRHRPLFQQESAQIGVRHPRAGIPGDGDAVQRLGVTVCCAFMPRENAEKPDDEGAWKTSKAVRHEPEPGYGAQQDDGAKRRQVHKVIRDERVPERVHVHEADSRRKRNEEEQQRRQRRPRPMARRPRKRENDRDQYRIDVLRGRQRINRPSRIDERQVHRHEESPYVEACRPSRDQDAPDGPIRVVLISGANETVFDPHRQEPEDQADDKERHERQGFAPPLKLPASVPQNDEQRRRQCHRH